MSKSTSTRASTSMFSSAHDLTFQGTQSFNAAGHDMYTPTIAPTINVNFTAGPVTNNIPIGQVDGQSSLLAGLIQPSSQKPRRGNSFREFAARLIGSLVQGPSETTSGSSSAETGSPQASAEQSTHSVSESSSYRSANGACTVSLIEDLDALFAKETLTTPEIYTTSLLGSGKGLACWQPHPNPPYAGETGIVPGDVGTFDAEDGFCKIFNLWDDEAGLKARAQTSGVFYTSPGRETVCREDLRQDETVVRGTSTDIEYTRDGRDISSIRFQCRSQHGAVLVSTSPADLLKLVNQAELKEHLLQHPALIYDHANSIRRVGDDEPLYIITGCIKSECWALAAFDNACPEDALKLIKRGPNHIHPYDWAQRGTSQARIGKGQHGTAKDQSLFLRGFKLDFSKEFRSRTNNRLPIKTATPNDQNGWSDTLGSPHPPRNGPNPEHRDENHSNGQHPTGRSVSHSFAELAPASEESENPGEFQVDSFPYGSGGKTYHPCDIINAYLLAKTGSDFSLCHDDDWRHRLQWAPTDPPEGAPTIAVCHGVACLVKEDERVATESALYTAGVDNGITRPDNNKFKIGGKVSMGQYSMLKGEPQGRPLESPQKNSEDQLVATTTFPESPQTQQQVLQHSAAHGVRGAENLPLNGRSEKKNIGLGSSRYVRLGHRITGLKRYTVSNDVLISILEEMDPDSLCKTCKVFDRVCHLVMQFYHLRYKLELALGGMIDGAMLYSKRAYSLRFEVLFSYRKDWPELKWSLEKSVKLPSAATLLSVTGDFVVSYVDRTLEVVEVPSSRLNRSPAQTRHMRYRMGQDMEHVVIDAIQALIVVVHGVKNPDEVLGIRLKIRDLWTFEKHPAAKDAYYDFLAPLGVESLENMVMLSCGNKLVVSLRCSDGMKKHLIINWRTYEAVWFDEQVQSIHFITEKYVLGAKALKGRASILLYNLMDLSKVIIEREYELPTHWGDAEMIFAPNVTAPRDAPIPSRALFCANPDYRVVLLSAQQPGGSGPKQWLFVNESHFRPTSRQCVPWTEWSSYCVMKNIPASLRCAQVVGNRIIYLIPRLGVEEDDPKDRLGLIDFPPYPEASKASVGPSWFHVGQKSVLVPTEYSKDIPLHITQGIAVDSISATEDNLVIFLKAKDDTKFAHVLTFGVPPSRSDKGKDGSQSMINTDMPLGA